MTLPSMPDLARLGDSLERAAAHSLSGRRRRVRAGRAFAAVMAITLIGAGTAVAAGVFSPKQVAGGMPAGSVIFGNTHPTCTADADGVTFHCTLASAPQDESEPVDVAPTKGGVPVDVPGAMDYLGSKQLIGLDDKVAGGCIGRSHDGLTWDCYVGLEAVRQGILTEDFLGQPMTEPGRG